VDYFLTDDFCQPAENSPARQFSQGQRNAIPAPTTQGAKAKQLHVNPILNQYFPGNTAEGPRRHETDEGVIA